MATLYTNLKPQMKSKNRSEVQKPSPPNKKKTTLNQTQYKHPQVDKNTLNKTMEIKKKKTNNSISQVKIGSLNVNGLGQQGKREKTLKKLSLKNDDFIILVDTRLRGESLKKYKENMDRKYTHLNK